VAILVNLHLKVCWLKIRVTWVLLTLQKKKSQGTIKIFVYCMTIVFPCLCLSMCTFSQQFRVKISQSNLIITTSVNLIYEFDKKFQYIWTSFTWGCRSMRMRSSYLIHDQHEDKARHQSDPNQWVHVRCAVVVLVMIVLMICSTVLLCCFSTTRFMMMRMVMVCK
jgi:hypothetical protein